VVLGGERACLIEGAVHRPQIREGTERRGAREAVRRVVEDALDQPFRLVDRPRAASGDDAQPARSDAFELP
jgi:hypothetical protein